MSADLAAEIAAHRLCTFNGRCGQQEPHCARCRQDWPCLVRRLSDAHAECTNLSQAEAARIFEEAREQRERAERAEADLSAALLREAALREMLYPYVLPDGGKSNERR